MLVSTQARNCDWKLRSSLYHVAETLAVLTIVYMTLKLGTTALWLIFDKALAMRIEPMDPKLNLVFSISFCLFFAPWLYLFNCMLASKSLSVDVPVLVLYMGATFFCAQLGEVGVDTLFQFFINRPAWEYKIWPAHNGYISYAGVFMWPLYGFFLYFLHSALHQNPRFARFDNDIHKAVILGAGAMILEILANLYSLTLFDSYFFYYLRGDLHHFTTVEIFVPYVMLGFIGMKVLKFGKRQEKYRCAIGLGLYVTGLINLFLVF